MSPVPENENIAGILVFHSIHHVLAAEASFKSKTLWCDLVPTPRTVSSDCGMVLAFRMADRAKVADVIDGLDHKPIRVYQRLAGAFREMDRF